MIRNDHGLLLCFVKILQEADMVSSWFGEKRAHALKGLLYDTGTHAAKDVSGN